MHTPDWILFLSLVLWPGCVGGDDRSPDQPSSEEGEENDVDADVDADTDNEGAVFGLVVDDGIGDVSLAVTWDLTVTEAGMTGAVSYLADNFGAPGRAALEIELSGAPYVGGCEGCDLLFSVESTATEVGEAQSGNRISQFSLLETDQGRDLVVGYGSADGGYIYVGYDRVSVVGGGEVAQRRAAILESQSFEDGGNVFSNHIRYYNGKVTMDLEISYPAIGGYAYIGFFNTYCPTYAYSESSTSFSGEYRQTSGLDCVPYGVVDVWSLPAQAGDTLSVSVDTVASDSAFDPAVALFGPNGCLLSLAYDSFSCRFPPAEGDAEEGACPALQVEAPTTGSYQVLVTSLGRCVGGEATYTLTAGRE